MGLMCSLLCVDDLTYAKWAQSKADETIQSEVVVIFDFVFFRFRCPEGQGDTPGHANDTPVLCRMERSGELPLVTSNVKIKAKIKFENSI